ncbi:MAG TPA: histidine phosphatase family protein [Bacteroidales bacterium]|nr:histidine phosphatase family protein [Bacteroidales bacterium]
MKLLTLTRHAKSDWDNDLPDFLRPLNKRGNSDAPMLAEFLSKKLPTPDLVISSAAERAKQTALYFAPVFGYEIGEIVFEQELYHCGTRDFLKLLSTVPGNPHHIMLFAHNPGITDFQYYLTDSAITNIATSGTAHIELYIDQWNEISRKSGRLLNYYYPAMIKK